MAIALAAAGTMATSSAPVFLPEDIFLIEDTFGDSSPAQKEGTLSGRDTGVLNAQTRKDGGITSDQSWEWLPAGTASDYDIRLTKDSGDDPDSGSTLGAWFNLATTESWTWEVTSSGGTRSFTGTLEISKATDNLTILASSTVTVSLESL